MRRSVCAGAMALALAGCQEKTAESPAPAPGELMPTRAAGLWREVVTSDGTVQHRRTCLDAAAARRLNLLGDELARFNCVANRTWRDRGGWSFEHQCDMASDGRQETTGHVTGDLAERFTVTAVTLIEDSPFPQANGRHETRMEAVREGPCPAGWRPGEVRIDGGKRFNMLNTRPVR